jgi:hypothetical protein
VLLCFFFCAGGLEGGWDGGRERKRKGKKVAADEEAMRQKGATSNILLRVMR